MVVLAAAAGEAALASEIATLVVERGLGGDAADLRERLTRFRRDRGARADDARALAQTFARLAGGTRKAGDVADAGRLLALAFPDRIARARGKPGEFLMANGRAAAVAPHDALAGAPYLAIAEVTGRAGAARILLAAPLDEADVAAIAGGDIVETISLDFDAGRAALRARRTRRFGALVLTESTLPVPPGEAIAAVLAAGLATLGLDRLPWTPAQLQLRDRVVLVRRAAPDDWPDLTDAALAADDAAWLAPFLDGATALADLDAGASMLPSPRSSPGTRRGASTRSRPPPSRARPAPATASTTPPRKARRSRSRCRSSTGSPRTRSSPACRSYSSSSPPPAGRSR